MITIKDTIQTRFSKRQIFVLKVEMLSKLRMLLSSLFHSSISDREKKCLKNFATTSELQNAVTISGLIAIGLIWKSYQTDSLQIGV